MRKNRSRNDLRFVFAIVALLILSACKPGAPSAIPGEKDGGSVGDRVWLDADRDGIQDETEVGLGNIDVALRSTDKEFNQTTRTDADGNYSFNGVPAGEYVLIFNLPPDFMFSPQQRGDDASMDSDADTNSGETAPFAMEANSSDDTLDAGMFEQPAPPPVEPSPTPLIFVPGGEMFVNGKFTFGSGDCYANPSDFEVPGLLLRIGEGQLELIQGGIHQNIGPLLPNGEFDVSTGTGVDTERYVGTLSPDFSASGVYTFTTSMGTCSWDFTLEAVPQ